MNVRRDKIEHHRVYGLLDKDDKIVKVGVTYKWPYRALYQIRIKPDQYADYVLLEDCGNVARWEAYQREKHHQKIHDCLDGVYLQMHNLVKRGHKRAQEKVICCLYCKKSMRSCDFATHQHPVYDKRLSEEPLTLIPSQPSLREVLEPIHLASYRDWDRLGLDISRLRRYLDGKSASICIPTSHGQTRWIASGE